jgi:two-component system chemotaxis response regulator CheY
MSNAEYNKIFKNLSILCWERGFAAVMENKKTRILICDDSALIRKQLKDLLIKMDCEVVEAVNGHQVVSVFKEVQPDVVFMDIIMPEADGLEALTNIMAYSKDAKVVMLSSVGTSYKLVQALKSGAMDFIQKPYTVEQISKVITDIRNSAIA